MPSAGQALLEEAEIRLVNVTITIQVGS